MPRWSLPSPLWGINVPKGQVGFFSLSFRAAGAARGDVTARKHQPHLGRCSRLRLGARGAEEQRAGHRHRSAASKAAPVPGKLHPGDYPEVRSSLEPRCSLRGFSSLFSGSSSPLTPFPLRVNPGLNASLFFGPTKFPAPLSPVGSPGELSARCSRPTVIPNVPPGAATPVPCPGTGRGCRTLVPREFISPVNETGIFKDLQTCPPKGSIYGKTSHGALRSQGGPSPAPSWICAGGRSSLWSGDGNPKAVLLPRLPCHGRAQGLTARQRGQAGSRVIPRAVISDKSINRTLARTLRAFREPNTCPHSQT